MSEIPEKNYNVSFVDSGLPGADAWASQWDDDQRTLALTSITAPMGQDNISFSYPYTSNSTTVLKQSMNQEHFWKFGEGETLKAVNDYIISTYNAHYASEKSKVQVLDMIDAIGDGIPFCRDNLIKYSSRFGKKDGMSKLDALKIIHYGVLLYHFAGFNNETAKSNYETF